MKSLNEKCLDLFKYYNFGSNHFSMRGHLKISKKNRNFTIINLKT